MSEHHQGSRFIQHHYDDAQHQFESGKLGIWVFLTQEILFFAGLFVAYIVYRSQHPEIFYYAHKYLDVKWGATNTVVLLLSSLSAAWAVRAAQLGQRKVLMGCLAATILCACGFMGIKYVEYTHKIHDGILFGTKFAPEYDPHHVDFPKDAQGKPIFWQKELSEHQVGQAGQPTKEAAAETSAAHDGGHGESHGGVPTAAPANTNMFFTIYFAMTGLHGLHVLIGIFIFIWLLYRAYKGHFTHDYYGPVDYSALYWHLVDLIWIYLFPLLYLIH